MDHDRSGLLNDGDSDAAAGAPDARGPAVLPSTKARRKKRDRRSIQLELVLTAGDHARENPYAG